MLNYIPCDCCTDAFEKGYNLLEEFGEIVESRIGKTKHLTNVTFEIKNPHHNVCLNKTRNLSLRYILGEMRWYMSGSNKVAEIAQYAKMWATLTDDGETVNSAYGYRIFHQFGFDQLQFCIDKLKANLYDRQAVIHIKDPSNKPTKDTPCTCLLQFVFNRGRLNVHVYMRSNDIWLGLPYDTVFFSNLLLYVSDALGVPAGTYYHTVGDLHVYEKHWGLPVKHSGDYDLERASDGWCYFDESSSEIQEMIDGKMPANTLLAKLWRINQDAKKDK